MLLKDTSFWGVQAVDNLILEIKVPGRDTYNKLSVNKDFLQVVDCQKLSICFDGHSVLPDGVYRIRLSYNPNLRTMVEFLHLRDTQLRLKLIASICNLKQNKCNLSKREFTKVEQDLAMFDFNIRAAKYMVEECGDMDAGMQLYNDVSHDINNYSKCNC